MVGAYKVSRVEELLKYVVSVTTILLPNIILGEAVDPRSAATRLHAGGARRRDERRREGGRGS